MGKRREHRLENGIELKFCSVCQEWKTLDSFSRCRHTWDDLYCHCRICTNVLAQLPREKRREAKRIQDKEYYQAHKAEIAEKNRRHYCEHHDEEREIQRVWRQAHAEQNRAKVKAYRNEHREWNRERQKQYRLRHLDRVSIRHAAYRETHKEHTAEISKTWAANNQDKIRAKVLHRRAMKRAAAGADYTTEKHIRARWEVWGGRCWICGAPATQTDHVKPLAKGGAHWPCNLRPICKLCNQRKSHKWPYPEDILHPVSALDLFWGLGSP